MKFNDIIDEIAADVDFFQDHDNHELLYSEFTAGNGVSYFTRITSERFLAFLSMRYADIVTQDKPLDIKRAIRYIRNNFLYFKSPPVVDAFIRKAGNLESGIEYDLCAFDGKVIEIDSDGWRISEKSKYKFIIQINRI